MDVVVTDMFAVAVLVVREDEVTCADRPRSKALS